jgi:hypothetical protein
VGIPLIFLMAAFPMFSAAMTLLESVANSEPKVREWPGFSFFDHIGELLLFATALAASAAPGFLVGGMIARSGGITAVVVFATLFTTFLTFPIIMLSMLDNDSLFSPFSSDVMKSLSIGYEAWGVYYFKTFIAFSILFVGWMILLPGNAIMVALAGAMFPWLIFFTSQQLGVLARDISEHLMLGISEPKKEDEESEEP